ncbi:hypothetical protein nbrc107696_18940 [Gordonia spumicola]|uniref:Uncharacterized protein n=1 Tax=Gordonia spumicola TaxID=589161 RepID=A0A7I9V7T5_9ACTN|nr:hypothetical protein [Gordonia spumicola]GEE01448.1 hypothetical protein nbrc107696_18940 [Gordonia spumicola]
MAESTATASRAGWHAQHLQHGREAAGAKPSTSTRGERARILREAMRQLDDADAARQAKRNPSIVAADTHLNAAYVNDGNGGLRELTAVDGVEAVLDYGDGRIDAVKRKLADSTFETTTIVAWVPKSLLKEIPAYYPVFNKAGTEIGRRSRWVMPDDEAGRAAVSRWFAETHAHLTTDVLTGGHDAVHGVVWNFDESAVHVHWMADTFAPMVKSMAFDADGAAIDEGGAPVVKYGKPVTRAGLIELEVDLDGIDRVRSAPEIAAAAIGGIDDRGRLVDYDGQLLRSSVGAPVQASPHLRTEAQQMWGQSREVTEERTDPETGKTRRVQITGATKMHRYQEVYRRTMLAAGIDVEAEVNPRGTSLDKKAFGASEAEKLELANARSAVATKERDLARAGADLDEAMQLHQIDVHMDEEELSARDAETARAEAKAREALAETEASLARQRAAEDAQREALAEEETRARAEADQRLAAYEREQQAAIDERVEAALADLRAEVDDRRASMPPVPGWDPESVELAQSAAYVAAAKRWELTGGSTVHDQLMSMAAKSWRPSQRHPDLDSYLADTVASVRARGAEMTGRIGRSAPTHGLKRRDRELGD